MARPSVELIEALRKTANRLEDGSPYQWGHMGSCNCGNLAQVLTPFTKAEIHEFAMQKSGDWSEQLQDYCPASEYPMDLLITRLLELGLSQEDLRNLEWLSDEKILTVMKVEHLRRNDKKDVINYLRTWADMLESKLVEQIKIGDVLNVKPLSLSHLGS